MTVNFAEAVTNDFGFDSMQEFNRMVCKVDVRTRGKVAAFRDWQHDDGTKTGLTHLLERTIFCNGCDKLWKPEQIIAWNRNGMKPLCKTCGGDCRVGLQENTGQ